MKLYKLNQGSTFENLKHFIYITNEYGKPSSEFIDSFIENFGKTILINNFPISGGEKNDKFLENVYRSLDNLWTEIEQDCKDNQTTCAYNYGSLFYYIIGNKALSILKDTIGEQEWNTETEDNKLIYLKVFIEDFDDNTAEKYRTEFEQLLNTVEKESTIVVEKEQVVTKKLTRDEQAAQVQAKLLAEAESVAVVKPLVPNFVGQYIKNNIHVYKKEKAIVEVSGYDNESQYFYWDYITGELKYIANSEHNTLAVDEQGKVKSSLNIWQSNRTIAKIVKKNALLDINGVETRVSDNIITKFIEVDNDELYKSLPEPEQQSTVKHYRLKAEYNSSTKSDTSLIDCEIDFNNGTVATIVSDTEININNSTVDIGEYIAKNNIDTNSVTIAWNWFNEVYEQY